MRRALKIAAALVSLLILSGLCRHWLHHRIGEPPAELIEQAARVEILRDAFGVPHVFGRTDADAAFGLAYAIRAHLEREYAPGQEPRR